MLELAAASQDAFNSPGMTRPHRDYIGQVAVPQNGGQSTPLTLPDVRLGVYVDLEVSVTLSVVQAAGSAAPTLYNRGPWNFVQSLDVTVAGIDDPVEGLNGFDLQLISAIQTRSFTTTSAFPLPGANAGTTAVTTNENWTLYYRAPLALSYAWPKAMIALQNRSLVTQVAPVFSAAGSVVNLPAGDTASWTNGQVSVYLSTLDLPANPKALPASVGTEVHQWLYLPWALSGAKKVNVDIPTGAGIRYLRLVGYNLNNGDADQANALGLANVNLVRQVSDLQQVWTYGGLREDNAREYRQALPGGAWAIDGMAAYPRDTIDASALTSLQAQLQFTGAAPTQPAEVHVLTEAILTQ